MSILKTNKLFCILIFAVFGAASSAQEGVVSIQQDAEIPALLDLKTQLGKESKLNDRYKIQLFYGQLEKANIILKEYRGMPFVFSSSIEYETPNYKVWVGNFRNRLEADRALKDIKISFPNAFIFKPDRK